MNIEDLKNICVVGAGNMGHQISTHCAIQGFNTTCTDVSQAALTDAEAFVDRYLPGRVEKGKLTDEQAHEARGNIRFTSDLKEAVADADYVIEAVVEVLDVKRSLFAELDRLTPPHAVLATNSSYIVSSRIANATRRPDKVLNLHFFNPALVMKLVEVVQGSHVSDETTGVSLDLCKKLDKIPVHVKKEVRGFLVNRFLARMFDEAQWILEMEVASIEDIDNACVHGLGHPMGPLKLMDLTGIDLEYTVAMEAFKETGDPRELPRPSLVARYVKGAYGRKAGKGWYVYD